MNKNDGLIWPLVKCPTLELLESTGRKNMSGIDGVVEFLQTNPTIKKFAVDLVSKIATSLRNSNVVLDDLAIRIGFSPSISSILIDLFNHGRFRRLHVNYYNEFDEEAANLFAPISAVLVKLTIQFTLTNDLTAFSNLQELCINGHDINDPKFDDIASKLVNLKRVIFGNGNVTFDQMLSLMSQAEKLNKIYIKRLHYSVSEVINLRALNKARKKLARGRNLEVTIYVREKFYLATKLAMNVK